jgi:ribonuclease HI
MVKQLNAQYKVINENIQPLFLEIWNLKFDFQKVKFKQIPREKNKQADFLANQALDAQSKTQKLI